MDRRKLQLIIVLAIFSIVGVAITQLFWIKKAITAQDNEFNYKVTGALNNVATSILKYNQNTSSIIRPVVKVGSYDYAVKVNDRINPDLLKGLLEKEFYYVSLNEKYVFQILDCSGKIVANSIGIPHSNTKDIFLSHTKFYHDNHYFRIYFPERKNDLSRNVIWVFSFIIILSVLILFGILLYIILRQKKLSEIQRDFVNNMTHEFKTPLTSIAMAAEVLKNDKIYHSPQKLFNYASIIYIEALKLEKNVERILHINLSDKSTISLNYEIFDVHSLLISSSEKFMNTYPSVKFDFEFSCENSKLNSDMLHVTNILNNLIDNAIKYGIAEPVIILCTKSDDKFFEISVKDNGPGIPKQYQNKIFDNFFRISSGNLHNVKGFGLGLYYVKTLMKAHKGKVTLQSIPGMGSEFKLYFPIKP